MSHYLRVYAKALADGNYLVSHLRTHVYLHAMSHVEYLIHLFPVCAGTFLDGAEEGRNGEHVVFYHFAVLAHEVEHLGLRTTRAMYHAMYLWAHLVQQLLDDGRIGTGRGEHELTRIHGAVAYFIGQLVLSAIYQFLWYGMVVALGILLCQVLGEHVVTGTGKSIAAHAAVIFLFVCGLPCAAQPYNHVSRAYICVVNHVFSLHAACNRRVHDDSAHQVAYVRGLTPSGIDANAHGSHFGQQLVCAIDDGRYNLAWHQHLVPADGARHEDVVYRSHAEQVIGIHHDGILCYSLPYAQVARLLPIHIGK